MAWPHQPGYVEPIKIDSVLYGPDPFPIQLEWDRTNPLRFKLRNIAEKPLLLDDLELCDGMGEYRAFLELPFLEPIPAGSCLGVCLDRSSSPNEDDLHWTEFRGDISKQSTVIWIVDNFAGDKSARPLSILNAAQMKHHPFNVEIELLLRRDLRIELGLDRCDHIGGFIDHFSSLVVPFASSVSYPSIDDCSAVVKEPYELIGHFSAVHYIIITDDGHFAFTASVDGCIGMWDLSTTNCVTMSPAHNSGVSTLAIQGRHLASSGRHRGLKIWSIYPFDSVKTLDDDYDRSWDILRFDDNATRLLCSSEKMNEFWMWSLESGQCIRTFKGHSNNVIGAYFVNGCSQLVSCSSDGSVRFWDANDGQCLRIFNDERDRLMFLRRSSMNMDGTLLFTVADSCIIWKFPEMIEVGRLEDSWPYDVIFHPKNDSMIVKLDLESTLEVFDWKKGETVKSFEGGRSNSGFCFTPDGRRLLASINGTFSVQMWNNEV